MDLEKEENRVKCLTWDFVVFGSLTRRTCHYVNLNLLPIINHIPYRQALCNAVDFPPFVCKFGFAPDFNNNCIISFDADLIA